ncbi:MAG TPA: phosphoenolpyruvate--protein phosphotransferase [Burkholderiaceae bacterium]|nr:phosphoenolpyruvate--protein phosphotransferase [Burkholderiaceae bacterium]
MSKQLIGQGVARGIVIGRAHLLAPSELEIRQYHIQRGDVLHEVARLNNAFSLVRAELEQLRANVAEDAPPEVKAFLDLHRMILDDSLLCDAPRDLVRTRLINAEWALTIQLEEVCRQFEAIEDEYFRSRSEDVRQVVERVLRRLAGGRPSPMALAPKLEEGERLVLVAHDLAPADILHFREDASETLAGFITELGGPTSHTMILARSLGLPAIVGVADARSAILEGDLIVVDSDAGRVLVQPDEQALADYRRQIVAQSQVRSELRKLRGKLARTKDGIPIELSANIEMPEDVRDALDAGADGVGLFRTEFLFMNRDQLPTEDEQFESYAKVARAMKGKPVVIRTLDIGADKVLNYTARQSLGLAREGGDGQGLEPNPALGLRAIRYCLAYPELFLTQLRAILRASSQGTIRILVPMLAHMHEIEQALQFVARAKEQLKQRRLKFDARVPVGGMIEVPAAALSLGPFIARLKFLSLGTNDLIQYALAIDRTDAAVAYLYEPLHPAVLQLIHQTIRSGSRAGLPVSVCGEMAGDLGSVELLLGMGLRRFSMNPAQLLSVKQRLFELDSKVAARLAARIARMHDPLQIRAALERAQRSDRRAAARALRGARASARGAKSRSPAPA